MIYKYIDIENYEHISEKVYNFVLNKTQILQENATWNTLPSEKLLQDVPELLKAFESLGLKSFTAERFSIVKCNPKLNIKVHIDNDTHARILWPIKNCKGSYTKFFEVGDAYIEKKYGVKGDLYYHIEDISTAKLLESVELIKPIVFDPRIPHGVWSNPLYEEARLTLTIKFDKSLDYMLI
jgi:hypothetical protein